MLKEIINAFRKKDVVQELSTQIGQMLDAGKWMFEQASDVLVRQTDWDAVSDPLYAKDKQINQLEQVIREQIVTHLTVAGQSDVVPCLALMSVVKDAERIGDYCKNIFEVGKFYRDAYEHREFRDPLDEIRNKIADMFEPTKNALINSENAKADEIIKEVVGITKQCDMIIQQLLRMQGEFAADEAVAYVLLARHFKRVASHLANIATSVVSPVPLLDFR